MTVALLNGASSPTDLDYTLFGGVHDPLRWSSRLVDARGQRVVFLAQCLLNQNTRCLGGPGLYTQLLRAVLSKRGLGVAMTAHDLVAARVGQPASTDIEALLDHPHLNAAGGPGRGR